MKDNYNLYDEFLLSTLFDDFGFYKYSGFKRMPDDFVCEQNHQVCRKWWFLYNDVDDIRICPSCRIKSIIYNENIDI